MLTPEQTAIISPQIHALHEASVENVRGAFTRDERRWKAIETLTSNRRVAVLRSGAKIEAYMALHADSTDRSGSWVIHEIVSVSAQGSRALLGFLSRQKDAARIKSRMNGAQFKELGLDRIHGVNVTCTGGVMLRIIDLDAVLSAISQTSNCALRVRSSKTGLSIWVDGAANSIDGDIGALTQMITGYASASALVQQNRIRATSSQALEIADMLFPPTDIFLGFADRF